MKEERFFYVPEALKVQVLPTEESIHALRVLRLQSGEEIFLMDGKGFFYRAEVTMTSSKQCMYKIVETLPQKKSWKGRIHLVIAPTKMMDRIEWMVEKATEVGVDEFTFLDCQFSERKTLRTDRLEKIVISAMKQSRKPWKPIVNPMTTFKDFITCTRQGHLYLAHCYDDIERNDLYNKLQNTDDNQDITILIGPEGDFSVDEVHMAMLHGYDSVSLGSSRLRTETAGLFAVVLSNLARKV